MRDDKRFPRNPDVVKVLQNLDAESDFHTNYGQRLTAYLQVFVSSIANYNGTILEQKKNQFIITKSLRSKAISDKYRIQYIARKNTLKQS